MKKSESYILDTNGIEITVVPEFIESQTNLLVGVFFVWAYHIKIENKGSETMQLTHRYWRILDEKGSIQEVSGEGVVGEQPVLEPGATFEYSSGVHLRYPSGVMMGHYTFKKSNGEVFEAKIPTFSLDIPGIKESIN